VKKVLITGANSYIGGSFESYIREHFPETFSIASIDMVDGSWKEKSFAGYDVVFHVAGIAHADVSHVSEETKQLYYQVNTQLAIDTAKKAKADGVRQFIFMSSMIVYGGLEHVTADTKPKPANFYGDSKWRADEGVRALAAESFCVTVLRPPMIYGKGSKGNYPTLASLARKLSVFPKVNNVRSMLYIENLCECIRILIDTEQGGVFFPQNSELVNTSELVKEIAAVSGSGIAIAPWLAPFVAIGRKIPGKIGNLCRKAFGSSYYDLSMSEIGHPYRVVDFRESIRRTEGN
jgi:UDP-glucose 4-epimerase